MIGRGDCGNVNALSCVCSYSSHGLGLATALGPPAYLSVWRGFLAATGDRYLMGRTPLLLFLGEPRGGSGADWVGLAKWRWDVHLDRNGGRAARACG